MTLLLSVGYKKKKKNRLTLTLLSQHSCVVSAVCECVWWNFCLYVFIFIFIFIHLFIACLLYIFMFSFVCMISVCYVPHSLLHLPFFHLVALFYQCIYLCVCLCPDEELAGYSCLHRCPFGGIVAKNLGHQPAAKRLIKVILSRINGLLHVLL